MQVRAAGHIAVLHRRRGAGIAFRNLGARRTRQVADLVNELKEIALLEEEREPERTGVVRLPRLNDLAMAINQRKSPRLVSNRGLENLLT